MKISNRRIALLTGVSAAVIGYAVPAHAATTVQPGVCTSSDTLDITLVGDTGVTSVNNPALAVVSGCATGEIIQGPALGGDVTATMTNSAAGDVNIVASASATNPAGDATAAASIIGAGVDQLGEGTGHVSVAINNAGGLAVEAIANATATGVAHASANFGGTPAGYGVYQSANGFTLGGATSATAALDNVAGASLTVLASANANGATGTANAHEEIGIWQIADGASTLNVDLTNDGTINIDSFANANGTAGAANASATVLAGVVQVGYSGSTVAVNLDNAGTMAINVAAAANGATDAVANAHLTYGIAQSVAFAGSGVASLTNAGTIAMEVDAHAVGGTLASANATIGGGTSAGGIVQVVNASGGTSGAAVINNGGAIDIAALASATATGIADARAAVSEGALQSVNGNGGDASASVANDGTFAVTASAHASGGTAAFALAAAGPAVHQLANTAPAILGTATYTTTTTTGGIVHTHTHTYVTAAAAGDASASVNNSGTISVLANAAAVATGAATAVATALAPVVQIATAGPTLVGLGTTAALVGGDASVTLDNSGTISAAAVANASGDVAFAHAFASGVGQVAVGSTASVSFDNSGELAVVGAAIATGGSTAAAQATIYGVSQLAQAAEGEGSVSLDNSGTVTIGGLASAQAAAGGSASSLVLLVGGINQSASSLDLASASLSNSGEVAIAGSAHASAVSGVAQAGADVIQGIIQAANGLGTVIGTTTFTGDAEVTLDNSGTVGIAAHGAATGAVAFGNANISTGVAQFVGAAGVGNAVIDNSGTFALAATATALASDGTAAAGGGIAVGLGQRVFGAESANASINNSGSLSFSGGADAAALTADGDYSGFAQAIARLGAVTFIGVHGVINQSAIGGSAIDSLTNSGTIDASVAAVASGTQARAGANVIIGVKQVANGFAGDGSAVATNSDTMSFGASALAHAAGEGATAVATVGNGFEQQVRATNGNALASLDNSGTFNVAAAASATGTGDALAYAIARGVAQSAHANGTIGTGTTAVAAQGTASFDNSGTFDVAAVAAAVGGSHVVGTGTTADLPVPTALASAVGVGQFANNASFVNSGTFDVLAAASASGVTLASASAQATGVLQFANSTAPALSFANSGTMNVQAAAAATAATGVAHAFAVGYDAFAAGVAATAPGLTVSASNAGTLNVTASAVSPGTAVATAIGMRIEQQAASVATSAGVIAVGVPINGSTVNSGTLNVIASAIGGSYTTVVGTGATATTVTIPQNDAVAVGISVLSGVNNMTITNSGSINVEAISSGGPALATGIQVRTTGDVTPAAGDILTINNSGDIIVRYSTDGGTTFHRGTAIDVAEAPNPTVINLLGHAAGVAAHITGDINLQSDADRINVTSGETVFNGVINAGCMPATLALDDAAQNDCGVGTLAINNGGNLHLVIDPVDGPSYVFVDTFDMRPLVGGTGPGTVTFDLPAATGGTAALGTYPQIFADTVHLGGTLVANIASPNGLYETTTYENVIDGVTRDGTFTACTANGVPGNSLLLSFGCIYDANANVDLKLTRAAFDSVAGLNANGLAVGGGLECIYDVGLTGGAAQMFADLFRFTNAANYNTALNMLSGSAYANYLNSFPSLGVHYNDLTDHATNCEVPALAGSVLECRQSSPIHVWGQLDYQTRKADGDVEAGTSRSKRFTGLLGLDAVVGNSAIIGVDGGYVTNHLSDRQFGDTVKGDGWQVGAYAVYDPGSFFVKGVTTYSSMNGDSNRTVDFSGLATGATFAGKIDGSPDVKMWTAGLHAGARLPMGEASVVTPYLNYDYVHAKLDSFVETGLEGANLSVEGGRSNHSFLTAGAKWAAQFGGVVPEVNLGYRYRFGDQSSSFGAFFNGDNDCDFDVVSAAQKRGTFLAGLSVGGKVGPVDVRIGYEGEFNGDVTSHSGNFKFVLPLGGHKAAPAPAPAPAPVVAPPPPPPPAAEPAPPPPPPPAPVERGERGM